MHTFATTVLAVAEAVWPWLPELTVGLKFASALIGFGMTVAPLARRR
ncbi:hypothetical protein AB0M43_34085 [Longispora sp. NPDC051575]